METLVESILSNYNYQTAKLLEKKRDSHRLNDVVDLLGGGFSTFGRSTHAHCSNCGNSKKVKHVSKPCCESPYLWMSAR